jgi:SAM-dependent methyltransferase
MSITDYDEDTRETTTARAGAENDESFGLWLAEVWDEEIEPPFARRFWEMALEELTVPPKGQVLVAGCSTGAIIPVLFDQVVAAGQGRVIALEARGPLLAKARARVAELDRRRVFLKGESIRKLRFANEVFAAVVSSLSWMDLPEPGTALDEFYRVLVPGGQVTLAVPLEGTLQEIYDLFSEVALKYDLPDVSKALEAQRNERHPSDDDAKQLIEGVGFRDVTLRFEERSLTFSTGRAFFESVLVKALFEPRWREVAGEDTNDMFRYTREAIDTYFVGEPLTVGLIVGCLTGRKPA